MRTNNFLKLFFLNSTRYGILVATAAIIGIPVGASAQGLLEEIVVTAQKREESLQDAPVAITAFTGDALDRAGVVDPESLAEMIPNVDVNSEPNRDGLVIVMRGIAGTDVRNGADPTTAFHVDGNYVPRLSGANAYFFDTERIEVLRGPQGTLYGRNSTSGVINVITKKPEQGEFSADGEVLFGSFNQLATRGAINIPLADNIAFRGAFMRNTRDGFVENGGPGSIGITDDSNDADELAFRGHLLWDISDDTSILFTAEHYQRNGVGQAGTNLGCLTEAELVPFGLTTSSPAQPTGANITCNNTSDPADKTPLDTQSFRDNHDNNFRIEAKHSFGFADLYYQGAYRSHNRDSIDDNDGSAVIANQRSATASIRETTHSDTWSHELRLTSNSDGPFEWITGLFWLEETIDGDFQVILARDPARNSQAARDSIAGPGMRGFAPGACTPTSPPGCVDSTVALFGFDTQIVQFIDRDLTNESFAAFFNGAYDLTDQFTLRAGVRWTRDKKDKGGSFTNPASGSVQRVLFINNGSNGAPIGTPTSTVAAGGPNGLTVGLPQVSNPEWNQTTWTAGLDWNVTEDLLTYVKAGTGFKSGGWNRGSQGLTLDGTLFVFDPETVLAYEGGAKWNLLEGRGRLNLAAYFYEYEDMQVASIVTAPNGIRTNTTFNAASSELWGIEAEGTLLFGESGTASVALGYQNTEFIEFPGFEDDFTGQAIDVTGNELARAPEFNVTFNIVPMTFEAFNGTWTPQVQVHYESSSFFGTINRGIAINGFLAETRESYTKTNLTLGYEHNGGQWYAEGFVYNLEDDDVMNGSGCGSSIGAASPLNNPVFDCGATWEPPRTVGIRIGFKL